MVRIVLFEPEIPYNTGNVIRLCANTGAALHLIHPLGFAWDNAKLRRAGMDYAEWVRVHHHTSLQAFYDETPVTRLFAISTRGQQLYHEVTFCPWDTLLFGPESRGLPAKLLQSLAPERVLRLPMQPTSRSLNLANAVAVTLYEAWRQFGFVGGR